MEGPRDRRGFVRSASGVSSRRERRASARALAAIGLLTACSLAVRASAATAPVPTFGGEVVGAWYSYLPSMGANLYEAVGDSLSWPVLEPDGHTFDSIAVNLLDGDVRNAFDYGVSQVLMRVRPGGGSMNPFAGSSDTWPVDTAIHDTKDGDYLGPKDGLGTESYPPRVLTDDAPGNTSPWYDFVYAVASRYNGTTPDPKNPGKLLPKIDYWSCVEEPDQKSFWYGTAADYFGGVGGNPAIGTLPTFYRAVKAANPDARIVAGGLASHEVGLAMVHELGRAHGDAYDASVRAYGASYFTTNYPIARLMSLPLSDTDLFLNFENDPERQRARGVIDAFFAAGAYYDIVAIHSYDFWEMQPDVVSFHRARMQSTKPIWFTELGFGDAPPTGVDTLVSESDQAVWLVKKMVLALADGVENVSYTPLFTFGGFAPIFPSASSERPARRSFQLVAKLVNEKSGYHFVRSLVSSGTELYVFDHADGLSHVAFAWRASDRAAQDARALLGIPASATSYVLDHLEHPVAASLSALEIGPEPVAILWSSSSLDADLDGYPRPVDCNDLNALVSPGLPENQGDSLDNDCNAVTPPGTSLGCAAVSGGGSSGEDAARAALVVAALAAMLAARRRVVAPVRA